MTSQIYPSTSRRYSFGLPRGFVAKAAIVLTASREQVWKALTVPTLIKLYFFGATVTTDWHVGSPITYAIEWQGKRYHDKGTILHVHPPTLLVFTFWNSLAGLSDIPSNYKTITYRLIPVKDGTKLTIEQDNHATRADAQQAEDKWNTMLCRLQDVLEEEV